MSGLYDEIQIFAGIAERTGNSLRRITGSHARSFCSSVRQLGSTSRRLGDGLYYLARDAWPAEVQTVDLNRPWTPLQ